MTAWGQCLPSPEWSLVTDHRPLARHSAAKIAQMLDERGKMRYDIQVNFCSLEGKMEHIITIETRDLCQSAANGGCGECQTSCQSACKTSCGIANQQCESKKNENAK